MQEMPCIAVFPRFHGYGETPRSEKNAGFWLFFQPARYSGRFSRDSCDRVVSAFHGGFLRVHCNGPCNYSVSRPASVDDGWCCAGVLFAE
jgi:hypothetical protein